MKLKCKLNMIQCHCFHNSKPMFYWEYFLEDEYKMNYKEKQFWTIMQFVMMSATLIGPCILWYDCVKTEYHCCQRGEQNCKHYTWIYVLLIFWIMTKLCSSETLVIIWMTTWHHNPDDHNFHLCCLKTPKSHMASLFL